MTSKKIRVLIVDDAFFTRNVLKDSFSRMDAIEICGEANNGNMAVKLYKDLKPDLVTMDIIMPEKGGIEAIREIMSYDPNANIIVISALGQESMILDATVAGAKDFLQKPFNSEDFVEVMNRIFKIS